MKLLHLGQRQLSEQLHPQRSRHVGGIENALEQCKQNLKLLRHGAFVSKMKGGARCVHQVSMETGVHQFDVDQAACAQLLQHVCSKANRDSKGWYRINQRSLPGYGEYRLHESDTHSIRRQQQYISMLFGSSLEHALAALPPFHKIATASSAHLGCSIENLQHAHLLVQYSPLALFSWHDDVSDLSLSSDAVTIIVPLNDVPSGLVLWGFATHCYLKAGCAVMFPAGARHRSVAMQTVSQNKHSISSVGEHELMYEAPVKLALFFAKSRGAAVHK